MVVAAVTAAAMGAVIAGGGGGGPAPVNQVAPYFCGQTGVAANADMVGGCSATTETAVSGNTLTVGTGVWTNSPTSFTYQWQRCTTTAGQPPTTGSCSDITSATSSSYTVQAADVGKALVPIVTAHNGATASTATTPGGSCATGSTVGGDITPEVGTTTIQPDPRLAAGCSPISAVAGSTTATMKFCTHAPVTCGFPDPLSGNAGVAHGTTLTTNASLTCGTGDSISDRYVTGTATVSGTCHISNSRLNTTSANGCTACVFDNVEFAGDYSNRSAATTGTGVVDNISSTCNYTVGGTGDGTALEHTSGDATQITLTDSYLHCAAEALNGSVGSTGSYIISDECFGPCYTGTQTHNEAIYEYGGQAGLNIIGNVILNPWHQTAGLFTDCGWNGSPVSEHVNGNLVATYDNNGALGVDNGGFGCTGSPTDNQVEGNRFSYLYNAAMNCGFFNGTNMTVSGNMGDDDNAAITSC